MNASRYESYDDVRATAFRLNVPLPALVCWNVEDNGRTTRWARSSNTPTVGSGKGMFAMTYLMVTPGHFTPGTF
ncbi:hypothetical protein [Streptomyces sp. DT203]|uniref:hypothetical protein n=1 Tax=Streptomyces sp. DT203 TaxID=3393424 RepID=UPI003CF4A713